MSQEQCPGWHQPENVMIDDSVIAPDGTIGFQQSTYSQGSLENLHVPNHYPAQSIPAQGAWTSFETGEPYNNFSTSESYPPLNNNSYHSSAAGSTPGLSTSFDFNAVDSTITPAFVAPQVSYPGIPQGYSDLNLHLSSGNFESYGQSMGRQPIAEQSQLNHVPTTSLGVYDLDQAPDLESEFPQFHNPFCGGFPVNFGPTTPSSPQLDPAQQSFSSFSHFYAPDTTTSGLNYDLNLDINHSNQDICQDMTTQWNSKSYLGNNSMIAPFTNPVQKIGSLENPIEITESLDSAPESQLLSTIVNRKHPLPKPFGPSRPISLPPARKGGRKGKLSTSELKSFRESKKQGVCIRCRQMKEKCHDGFPCKLCRENSDAVFWKFPCTKAQFLDLVERGSYYQGSYMETYQTYVIEKIDQKCLSQYHDMITAMLSVGGSKIKIVVTAPEGGDTSFIITWCRSAAALKDVCEQLPQTWTSVTSRRIIEIPYKLVHSKLSQPPLSFDDVSLSNHTRKQVFVMLLLCISRYTITETLTNDDLPSEKVKGFENNVAGIFKNSVRLLIWISRRYYEVVFFRALQYAANRMNSFSAEELSGIATAFLDILSSGLFEPYNIEDRYLYSHDSSDLEFGRVYLDRKLNIRQALFIYFSITLEKLPPWSDFWLMRGTWHARKPMEGFKHLTSLKAFDRLNKCENIRAKMHMNLLYKRESGSEVVQSSSNQVRHNSNIAAIDLKKRRERLLAIMNGPRNLRAELEAIANRLSEVYLRGIEPLEKFFNEFQGWAKGSLFVSRFASAIRRLKFLEQFEMIFREEVEKILGKQLQSNEPGEESGELNRLVELAMDLMIVVETIYSDIEKMLSSILMILEGELES